MVRQNSRRIKGILETTLQLLNKNLHNRPVGQWFLLFKNYKNKREEIKNLVSSDKDLDNFLQEKIDKGMDEKSAKRFWKQLESELWEQFLDETSDQANLWFGTNKNKKGK